MTMDWILVGYYICFGLVGLAGITMLCVILFTKSNHKLIRYDDLFEEDLGRKVHESFIELNKRIQSIKNDSK